MKKKETELHTATKIMAYLLQTAELICVFR